MFYFYSSSMSLRMTESCHFDLIEYMGTPLESHMDSLCLRNDASWNPSTSLISMVYGDFVPFSIPTFVFQKIFRHTFRICGNPGIREVRVTPLTLGVGRLRSSIIIVRVTFTESFRTLNHWTRVTFHSTPLCS